MGRKSIVLLGIKYRQNKVIGNIEVITTSNSAASSHRKATHGNCTRQAAGKRKKQKRM